MFVKITISSFPSARRRIAQARGAEGNAPPGSTLYELIFPFERFDSSMAVRMPALFAWKYESNGASGQDEYYVKRNSTSALGIYIVQRTIGLRVGFPDRVEVDAFRAREVVRAARKEQHARDVRARARRQ